MSPVDVIPPIFRDPAGATSERFDLVIVGGGIQGIMLALEATRRRLRPLLIERHDFAAATSYNSLRILHGGLRYLQSLDLRRSIVSIRERTWWLRWFPDLVQPLPCLMPLYGEGLRRMHIMWAGLKANDALQQLVSDHAVPGLPPGRIVTADEVATLFPDVERLDMEGGAIWHDAWAPEAPRLCIEALRWACSEGAIALNRVEARGLRLEEGRVAGVRAVDLETDGELDLEAPLVINAAGPDASAFLCNAGLAAPALPRVLAWNVAFCRPPLSTHGLALKRRGAGQQTHIVVPWKGGLCAGTPYASTRDANSEHVAPSTAQLQTFVDDLNGAIPHLGLSRNEIVHIYAGVLPAAADGSTSPAAEPWIIDHGRSGGPTGLISVVAPKLTTARAISDRLLRGLFPDRTPRPDDLRCRPPAPRGHEVELGWEPGPGDDAWLKDLSRAHVRDSALHLDDLLLRHAPLGDNPRRALRLAPQVADAVGFDLARKTRELAHLDAVLRSRAGLMPDALPSFEASIPLGASR